MSSYNRRDFIRINFGASLALGGLLNSAPARETSESRLLQLDASKDQPEIVRNFLKMGASRNPRGTRLTADSRSLLLGEKRWLPVMGEFHFARYPESEWRDELLKMKMGGIDIVASYIFWIHHEEMEGEFDWSGQRNLRKFIEIANDVGLYAVVRLGPWCHGEARNGGLPDWILKKSYKTRTDAPEYLEKVEILYGEIARQIKGLYWKDGGNIVAAQFENEFKGRAAHLLNLKRIALEKGIDVPLYTRTAWHSMASPLPLGEIMPLFGAYAEGFWDREITPMPGKYGDGFLFRTARIDASIATDQLGAGARKDSEDVNAYPYFCCEIGGGMMTSYHRRILNYPADIESIALVKIGSGNNLQGFYMYHGGTNPEGKSTTLHESQATNYWNDLPVKTYDFQAPLGEFGQINEHYHSLRRHHLFLRDFGADLADMPPVLPDASPADSKDTQTLRWSVRSDGTRRGFVFVNNYQRLQKMPAKTGVRFSVKLKGETLVFPKTPLSIPEDAIFFLPFNLEIGDAALKYATAQPVCKLENDGETFLFFAAIKGIAPEFAFDEKTKFVSGDAASKNFKIRNYQTAAGKRLRVVLFDDAQSLAVWKGEFLGRERIFLTKAGLILDGDRLRLSSENIDDLRVSIYPAPSSLNVNSKPAKPKANGVFGEFVANKPRAEKPKIQVAQIKQAEPPREIKKGSKGVAEAPSDADFERAAVWKISLPKNIEKKKLLLRIGYHGDVARVYLGERLLTDNFYNGSVFEIGLNRFAPEIYRRELFLKILPLRKDAPIYLQADAKPNFEGADSVCKLLTAELIEIHDAEFTLN